MDEKLPSHHVPTAPTYHAPYAGEMKQLRISLFYGRNLAQHQHQHQHQSHSIRIGVNVNDILIANTLLSTRA